MIELKIETEIEGVRLPTVTMKITPKGLEELVEKLAESAAGSVSLIDLLRSK
jgi:hypothetical protein